VLAAAFCNRRAFGICSVWRLTQRVAALGVCLSVVACGGDDRPSGDPVPVRGSQRLAWDQRAESLDALRAHTFNLYVDDSPAALIDPRCTETRTSGGYECSGGLPSLPAGRHVVSVTSVFNGIESARSAPLAIDVLPSGQLGAFVSSKESADQTTENVSGVCAADAPHEQCYAVETIASSLGPVTMLASTPDGQLLFLENETHVRVVANGAPIAEPAFAVQDGKSRIVGLAVDSRFSESHAVFLASTEPARNDGSALRVTRFREVGHSLGEGVTIIDALPFADDALAPMVVDREGRLYVALPDASIATRAVGMDASFAGAVIRFDREGRISRSDTQASPVFSYGYSRPTFITTQPINGRLWMGGGTATTKGVSAIDLGAVKTQPWPLRPFSIDTPWSREDPDAPRGTDLAFSDNTRDGAGLFASDGQLFLTSLTSDGGLIARGRLALGHGVPVRVASGAEGSWYISVVTPEGTTTIVRLKRRS
jgi:hypothetical protein